MKTDYDQLQELMAIYALAIDTKNYPGITDCFTPDAETVYAGHSNHLKGVAEIGAHMKKALEVLDATQHVFMNFIVDVEGDTAKYSCNIIAQHVQKNENYMAGGRYNVEAKRIGGKWKIHRVNAGSHWGMGNKGMLPKAG